jgi:hypothetical protein
MAMQRNSIARKLPWEIRELVCRLRFDGQGNMAIAAAVQAACTAAAIPLPKIHGTSILAYCKSREYGDYVKARQGFDARMAPRKLAASMVNGGHGPQTMADLALQASAEGLVVTLEQGGLEPSEQVKVARAVMDVQRTLLARQAAVLDGRIAELEEKHAAERAQLQAALAGRDEAITDLKAEIERLVNPSLADAAGLSDAEKAKRIRERLGI